MQRYSPIPAAQKIGEGAEGLKGASTERPHTLRLRKGVVAVLLGLLFGFECIQHDFASAQPQATREFGVVDDSESWRRTAQGWVHASALFPPENRAPLHPMTGVHPLLLATFQVLGCIGVYCLWPPTSSRQVPRGTASI